MNESFTQTKQSSLMKFPSNLEEQMLDALELFHYSFSFKDSLFVMMLQGQKSLSQLLTDLQLIQSSQIFLLIVAPHSQNLESEVSSYQQNGVPIEYFKHHAEQDFSLRKLQKIRKEYASHDVVVVGLEGLQVNELEKVENQKVILREALEIAQMCKARKFFYFHKDGMLTIDDKPRSHLSISDIKDLIEKNEVTFNLETELLLDLLLDIEKSQRELVFIDDSPGALFQEIFTHQGRGTLITDEYPNCIRKGEKKDVFMVSRLMKPYIEMGILLPFSEGELQEQINDFMLYCINDSIVAGARMKAYGEWAELAKFFCLPRFRRRGHARNLTLALINNARAEGKKFVFSLSIAPGMWDFLQSLNFKEIERELLPKEWLKAYDLNRKSKAFYLELD